MNINLDDLSYHLQASKVQMRRSTESYNHCLGIWARLHLQIIFAAPTALHELSFYYQALHTIHIQF